MGDENNLYWIHLKKMKKVSGIRETFTFVGKK